MLPPAARSPRSCDQVGAEVMSPLAYFDRMAWPFWVLATYRLPSLPVAVAATESLALVPNCVSEISLPLESNFAR